MNLKLSISLLEAIYLSYMFYFFKTGVDFNILKSPESNLFKHLTGNMVGLRICLFGQIMIIPLLIILILRNFISIPRSFITGVLIIAFIMSFMNMNALVFLLPFLLVEIFIGFYGCDVLPNSSSAE